MADGPPIPDHTAPYREAAVPSFRTHIHSSHRRLGARAAAHQHAGSPAPPPRSCSCRAISDQHFGQRVNATKTVRTGISMMPCEVCVMNEALKVLIEASQKARMPNAEREAQRRSFAFGNTHFENELITREMVDRAADALAARGGSSSEE